MHNVSHVLTAAALVAMAACVSSPGYQPPTVVVAPAFQALNDSESGALVLAGDSATPAMPEAGGSSGASVPVIANAIAPAPASADSARATMAVRGSVSGDPPDTAFWIGLGDSTLVALVNEAVRASPDVHAAQSRLLAARSSRRLSALDLAPAITANASVARQQLSATQFPGSAGALPRQDLWDAGFDASWELDIFGRVSRTVRAGRALEESAADAVHDAQLSLAAEVARTYFELRGAQSELAVANRNAANQRRTMQLTERRLSAGSGTAFDVERARAELNLTLGATPAIESRIAASRYRIAVLLGRAPEDLPPALLTAADLPPLPDTVRVGSPADLVRRRPDVLSAERQLAAETMLVGAARAEYLPRVSLAGSVGYTSPTFDALGNTGTPRYFVGPVVSWPFLDLGRVKVKSDIARAHANEARARYTSAVLSAISESETAIVTYDRSRARLGSLREAARASSRALELAQLRYETGETDFLQVLDAQRTLLSAESELATGRTAAATALVAVYKAVGGSWPDR